MGGGRTGLGYDTRTQLRFPLPAQTPTVLRSTSTTKKRLWGPQRHSEAGTTSWTNLPFLQDVTDVLSAVVLKAGVRKSWGGHHFRGLEMGHSGFFPGKTSHRTYFQVGMEKLWYHSDVTSCFQLWHNFQGAPDRLSFSERGPRLKCSRTTVLQHGYDTHDWCKCLASAQMAR